MNIWLVWSGLCQKKKEIVFMYNILRHFLCPLRTSIPQVLRGWTISSSSKQLKKPPWSLVSTIEHCLYSSQAVRTKPCLFPMSELTHWTPACVVRWHSNPPAHALNKTSLHKGTAVSTTGSYHLCTLEWNPKKGSLHARDWDCLRISWVIFWVWLILKQPHHATSH